MLNDPDELYRIVSSRDRRFDGRFVLAVTSTGIYCRPSCTAVTPKRANCRYFATAAAAQQQGFRACKRCRPDVSPGSPEWNSRADLVGRAMRLLGDGVVDREGVTGLARRLGYSERHLNRALTAELGAGPIALARAQRAQTARVLIETTPMPFAEVAFAAGFSSIRQFNDTIREVFAATPSEMRTRHGVAGGPAGSVSLRLPVRQPFAAGPLFEFLGRRAVPGVEHWDGTTYTRGLDLPHGLGTVALAPAEDHVRAVLTMSDWRDLATAVSRCRRLLDLDADPVAIDADLGGDPALAPLVAAAPGLRSPGHVDGDELAVRAVLGQQVSVAGARTLAGRLAERVGRPLGAPNPVSGASADGGASTAGSPVMVAFPRAADLAGLDPESLPLPKARARALIALCTALAEGTIHIHPGADRAELADALQRLPGIGPWTAQYVVMRALGDPDVFMPSDLGVRHALEALGLPADPAGAARLAERWRPWRSYALHHLWNLPLEGTR